MRPGLWEKARMLRGDVDLRLPSAGTILLLTTLGRRKHNVATEGD